MGDSPWRPPAADFGAAVKGTATGTAVALAVNPGAKGTVFPDGFDPWRERLGIRVSAPAKDGKANREVIVCMAEFFGVRADAVTIHQGERSPQKLVHVDGLSVDDALARLSASFGRAADC